MKLLYDQNLSHHLVHRLADLFPDSVHVRNVGMRDADDSTIWEYAQRHNFVIVTKDTDFLQRSFLFGHPPKVIWLRRGNCSTSEIETFIRNNVFDMIKFFKNEYESLFILS